MAAHSTGTDRELRRLAVVVVVGAMGSIFATTSVVVALTDIALEFDVGLGSVQWVATGYLLGLASSIPATGWLARRFSARRVYLSSLLAFSVASLACAVAPSIELLIGFRVVQGVVAGATVPVGQMILAHTAGSARVGRVMGGVGAALVLGPAAGPAFAGILVDALSWQWVFLMNVPLAVVAWVLGVQRLPRLPRRPVPAFDLRGFALMTAGPPMLIFGFARMGQGPALDPVTIGATAAGAALLGGFVLHAARTSRPLLDIGLWRNPGFAACATTAALVSATLFGTVVLLPLSFELVRGASATTAGLLLAPQSLGAALCLPWAGRATDRVGGGRVAVVGLVVLVAGTVPLTLATETTPLWVLCAALFVRGLGMGGSMIPAMAAAYRSIRPQQIADASPQLNVIQRISGAAGATGFGVVLAGQLGDISAGSGQVTGSAASAAFQHAFLWALGLTLLALVPASILARVDKRSRARGLDGRPAAERPPAAVHDAV